LFLLCARQRFQTAVVLAICQANIPDRGCSRYVSGKDFRQQLFLLCARQRFQTVVGLAMWPGKDSRLRLFLLCARQRFQTAVVLARRLSKLPGVTPLSNLCTVRLKGFCFVLDVG